MSPLTRKLLKQRGIELTHMHKSIHIMQWRYANSRFNSFIILHFSQLKCINLTEAT